MLNLVSYQQCGHTAYKPCVQTWTAFVTNQVSCLCQLMETVICRIWISWVGSGWETKEKGENKWLITTIKCRYYTVEYGLYFRSPQLQKMQRYDCEWYYSWARRGFVRTWSDVLQFFPKVKEQKVMEREKIIEKSKRGKEHRRCVWISIQSEFGTSARLCVCVCECECACVFVSGAMSWADTQAGLAGSQYGYIAPCQGEEAPSGGADRLHEPQKYSNPETDADTEEGELK